LILTIYLCFEKLSKSLQTTEKEIKSLLVFTKGFIILNCLILRSKYTIIAIATLKEYTISVAIYIEIIVSSS
jgi:hypothetical protein